MNRQRTKAARARAHARRRASRAALAVAAALLSTLAAGCGVRATSVPVDAGSAPSQAGCAAPGEAPPEDPGRDDRRTARLYLVCGAYVAPVDRRVNLPATSGSSRPADRLAAARTLLAALRSDPSGGEEDAGFETSVPHRLTVHGPSTKAGDPEATLRLSTPPARLPSFALAQLVCTYAENAATSAPGETVLLAGPDEGDRSEPPRRYECSTTLRTRTQAARTAGTPV